MYNPQMKIIRLEKVSSTHIYIKDYIKTNSYTTPLCVVTDFQTNGIGSRGNDWTGIKGNLFFSFVVSKDYLPEDLLLQSSSIYFSYILKDILKDIGSKIWLKWPNDFYIDDKKIGGTITTVNQDLIYCGIGLNLLSVNDSFGNLDIKIDVDKLLEEYFLKLEKKIEWKQIFKCFQIEFQHSQKFQATINNEKISLKNAVLNEDGSIQVNNKKVFSLR